MIFMMHSHIPNIHIRLDLWMLWMVFDSYSLSPKLVIPCNAYQMAEEKNRQNDNKVL
jgi:hypothetical protein